MKDSRTARREPRGCRAHEARQRPRQSRSSALEKTGPPRRRSAVDPHRVTKRASPSALPEFSRQAQSMLLAPAAPIRARSRWRSVAVPMTMQRWFGRAGASPICAAASSKATQFASDVAVQHSCERKRRPAFSRAPFPTQASRLRCSSSRRTRSCSWCCEACRAGSRSHPSCPSD